MRLGQFTGEILQRPPAFSAVHVEGRRADDLARRGQLVELPARPVRIDRIDILRYEYPELVLDVTCGSGTYIRALGCDLAESLATAAVMSALIRTAIGPFRLEDSLPVADLSPDSIETNLLPPQLALADLSTIVLEPDEIEHIGHGRSIERVLDTPHEELVAFDAAGKFIAIIEPRDGNLLAPTRVFL